MTTAAVLICGAIHAKSSSGANQRRRAVETGQLGTRDLRDSYGERLLSLMNQAISLEMTIVRRGSAIAH